MDSQGWNNPWKLIAVGMALVGTTALATGLVVGSWRADPARPAAPEPVIEPVPPARPLAAPARYVAAAPIRRVSTAAAPVAPAAPAVPAAPSPVATPTVPAGPSPSVAEQCAREAQARVGARDRTMEVVKSGAIGAVVGAVVGAAGGAIADGGSGAGKGAAIGGVLGAGSGAAYGLYGNGKHADRVREAQAACESARRG
jgi:hypothetical protein